MATASKRRSSSKRSTSDRPKPRRVAAAAAALRGNPFGPPAANEADAGDAPTERQMEIYAFIRDKIHSRGYGPTVREIQARAEAVLGAS
jgi:hypothetical protein